VCDSQRGKGSKTGLQNPLIPTDSYNTLYWVVAPQFLVYQPE